MNDGTRHPRSVIDFIPQSGDRGLHPMQKPVGLMEYLIRTYTKPGEIVLDNCMGSGTTGVACLRTGRRFVGIENTRKYFNTAVDRIEKAADEINGVQPPEEIRTKHPFRPKKQKRVENQNQFGDDDDDNDFSSVDPSAFTKKQRSPVNGSGKKSTTARPKKKKKKVIHSQNHEKEISW